MPIMLALTPAERGEECSRILPLPFFIRLLSNDEVQNSVFKKSSLISFLLFSSLLSSIESVLLFFNQKQHRDQLVNILLETDFEHHYAVYIEYALQTRNLNFVRGLFFLARTFISSLFFFLPPFFFSPPYARSGQEALDELDLIYHRLVDSPLTMLPGSSCLLPVIIVALSSSSFCLSSSFSFLHFQALEEELRKLAHETTMTHHRREEMVSDPTHSAAAFASSFFAHSHSTSSFPLRMKTSKPHLHLRFAPLGPGHGILHRVPQADSIGKLVEFAGKAVVWMCLSLYCSSTRE
jgi:hypothetical protein